MSSPSPNKSGQTSDLDSNSFRCAVRIRPLIARDAAMAVRLQVTPKPTNTAPNAADILVLPDDEHPDQGREFVNLNPVLGPELGQEEAYQVLGCSSFVRAVLSGFHATILAYGQTGSGKTHTVLGGEELDGIIPRAVSEIYEERDKVEAGGIGFSFMGIFFQTSYYGKLETGFKD